MPLQSLVQTVAPSLEPVSVEEVKTHLRITWTSEDAWVDSAIAAARSWMEPRLGRALISQTLRATFEMDLNRRPRTPLAEYSGRTMRELTFRLPRSLPGVTSVSAVEIETDLATWKTLTTSTDYLVDTDADPVEVWLRASALSYWIPSGALTTFIGKALPRVRVTYSAGYGAGPSSVPYNVRQALLNAVAYLYEHRGDSGMLPDSLLDGLEVVYNV